MISTARVWQRVNQLLKSGTSGYQSNDEFNSDMYSTLLDILNDLCDNYERNAEVSDLMNKSGLIVSPVITSGTDGTFIFPTGHYRSYPLIYVNSVGKEFPVKKINTNQVAMYENSPIRGFDFSKNKIGYYLSDGKFHLLPRQTLKVKFTYCIQPEAPVLITSLDENDYTTVSTATTDINLPDNLFNLFCYKMLERASIEMKENIGTEYSQLGISKE